MRKGRRRLTDAVPLSCTKSNGSVTGKNRVQKVRISVQNQPCKYHLKGIFSNSPNHFRCPSKSSKASFQSFGTVTSCNYPQVICALRYSLPKSPTSGSRWLLPPEVGYVSASSAKSHTAAHVLKRRGYTLILAWRISLLLLSIQSFTCA